MFEGIILIGFLVLLIWRHYRRQRRLASEIVSRLDDLHDYNQQNAERLRECHETISNELDEIQAVLRNLQAVPCLRPPIEKKELTEVIHD